MDKMLRRPVMTDWLVVLVLAALSPAAAAAEAGKAPKIVFENYVHDFGRVPTGAELSYDFRFTNDGDAPLTISRVGGSCTCMISYAESKLVEPGGTGSIGVKFGAGELEMAGKYFLSVETNDPAKPRAILILEVEVVREFRLSPKVLYLGALKPGETYERSIRILYSTGDGKRTKILRIEASSPDLKISRDDRFLKNINQEKIRIQFAGRNKEGMIEETISIHTDHENYNTVDIPVRGCVRKAE